MKLLFFLFLLLCVHNVDGSKFLLYNPKFGRSHLMHMGRIADHLAEAGHDVVVLQPVIDPNLTMSGHKHSKIRLFEVKDDSYAFSMDDLTNVWTEELDSSSWETLVNCFNNACKNLIASKAILDELRGENFDLAIAEYFDPCGLGIIKHLGIERWITVYGSTIPLEHLALLGVPPMSSTSPGFFAKNSERGFVARLKDQVGEGMSRFFFFPMFFGRVKTAFQTFEKEEDKNMDYRDLIAESQFIWVNSDEFVDFPQVTTRKVIDIGGLGIKKVKSQPFDQKLKAIYDKSKKGIIYMSFGSVAKSIQMPEKVRNNFLKAFSQFPEIQFIWKYENDSAKIATDYNNVHTSEWLPQKSILQNSKTLAFITHGGLNSIIEASYAGVPMITIPLFADQPRNSIMVARKKLATVLYKTELNDVKMIVRVIKEVVDNKEFKSNAQSLSQLIQSRPGSPEQRLIETAEFAAKHNVHKHLDIESRHMSVFEFYNIDVFVTFSVIIVVFLYTLFALGRCMISCLIRKLCKKNKVE